MKRLTLAMLLAGALAGIAAAAVSARPAPRAVLRSPVCHRALDPSARSASITAVMRPLPGTRRMQMRFDLLGRPAGHASFAATTGAGLGTWFSPTNPPTLGQRPGDHWTYTKPVLDLAAGAYRFRVGFRWFGARSRVLGTVARSSGTCRQPELRPDLLVQSFTATLVAGNPMLELYTAVIRNAGATAARNFEVQFTDAGTVKTREILKLGPHISRTLRFAAPACASGAPPSLVLDPQTRVDDSDRSNNTATAACPAPAPASTAAPSSTAAPTPPAATRRGHTAPWR